MTSMERSSEVEKWAHITDSLAVICFSPETEMW